MRRLRRILEDKRGAGALEFALVAPAFIVLVIGIAQLGLLFFANAGLNNAISEGARRATLYPRPDAATVRASLDAAKFGLKPEGLSTPTITYVTTASPSYADISMEYTTTLNFIVHREDVTLSKTRRVYLQPLPET